MKLIKKILLGLLVCIFSFLSYHTFAQNDLMNTIFWPSRNNDHIINIGNNKNAVGNEVFRGGVWLSWNLLDGDIEFANKAPLLVRITQTLLRLTIALSIPVIIFIGVKLIKSAMNGGKTKEAFQEVSWVLLWLVLALSAMGIIWLVQSLAVRSLSWVI